MTPKDCLEQCSLQLDLDNSTEEEITDAQAQIQMTIDRIQERIKRRGQKSLQNRLKGKKVESFEEGTLVLIKVPGRYRTSADPLYCRKGTLIEKSRNGITWRLKWSETGGYLQKDEPGTVSDWINVKNLRTYRLGEDKYLTSWKTGPWNTGAMSVEDEDSEVEQSEPYDDLKEAPVVVETVPSMSANPRPNTTIIKSRKNRKMKRLTNERSTPIEQSSSEATEEQERPKKKRNRIAL
jgi:hypothetical protein